MERGRFVDEIEVYERARLSLRCITILTMLWTVLVFLYFFSWYGKVYLPDSIMAHDSFPMLTDIIFELCSKGLLLMVVVVVHDTTFNDKLRIKRKLRELS